MKISKIQVEKYQQLQNVTIEISENSHLICLTGENGAGKTTLLRLLSDAMVRLGLASKAPEVQPSPAGESYRYSVEVSFSDEPEDLWSYEPQVSTSYMLSQPGVAYSLPQPGAPFPLSSENLGLWDKTIRIDVQGNFSPPMPMPVQIPMPSPGGTITAGGITDNSTAAQLMQWTASRFDSLSHLKHLHLDSNRAYSRYDRGTMSVEMIRQLETIIGKKAAANLSSEDLYRQWLEYLVDVDTNSLSQARGRARASGSQEALLNYDDPLTELNRIAHSVLPHITVSDTDFRQKQLLVQTGTTRLPFDRLSSGEREILFLAGQIVRLRLTRGVLLIDEPELHLNPDLVRRFISVIQETSTDGQLWFGTHSFEAIEATGAENTLLIERLHDGTTRVESLDGQPVVKTLTAALGRSGFSLVDRLFVLIEGGTSPLRERQRFAELSGHNEQMNFLDVGEGKKDVLRTNAKFQGLASASGEQLDIKAVVDADYDSLTLTSFEAGNVFTLPVHEVENVFLEPRSLDLVLAQTTHSIGQSSATTLILEISDSMAGRWIHNYVHHLHNAEWKQSNLLELTSQTQGLLMQLDWASIEMNKQQVIRNLRRINKMMSSQLDSGVQVYSELRLSSDLWKHCHGKEVLKEISRRIGVRPESLERLVIHQWKEGHAPWPEPVVQVRRFLGLDPNTL